MTTQPNQKVRTLNRADKPYQFDFSTFALAALQDLWGTATLDETLSRLPDLEDNPFKLLPDILWAGFRRYHPEITIEEVRIAVNDHGLGNIPALVEEIVAVCQASLPKGKGTRPQKRGTNSSR